MKNETKKNSKYLNNYSSSSKDITTQDDKERILITSTLSNNDKNSNAEKLDSFLDLNVNRINEFNNLNVYLRKKIDKDFNSVLKDSNINSSKIFYMFLQFL